MAPEIGRTRIHVGAFAVAMKFGRTFVSTDKHIALIPRNGFPTMVASMGCVYSVVAE